MREPAELLAAAREGDRGALARLLTHVERGDAVSREVGRLTFAEVGGGYTVGITGAPGAGKSTLTSAVVAAARARQDRVAVLAIDPSSPFSGGAILGDRVRMGEHALDPEVFIRSMATRGHLGGLALAAPQAIRVLDAVGYPWIVVETVGVGQVEVEVAGAADTTVVVVNPGWGDAVQANKAGLMEIADVFVINKADRPGAAQTLHDIEGMLDLTRGARGPGVGRGRRGRRGAAAADGPDGPDGASRSAPRLGGGALGGSDPAAEGVHGEPDVAGDHVPAWRPPVVSTVGTTGDGAAELWDAVAAHRAHLEATGELAERRRTRLRDELALVVQQRIRAEAEARIERAGREAIETELHAGTLDPWSAADRILGPLGTD